MNDLFAMTSHFIGRDKVIERRDGGISTSLVLVSVATDHADCLGNEPALDGDRPMGIVCSGSYGHRTKTSLAYVYVEPQFADPGSMFRYTDSRKKMLCDGAG